MQEDCVCLFTLLEKKKRVEESPGRAPSSLSSAHHRNTNKVGVTPDPEGAWTREGPITGPESKQENQTPGTHLARYRWLGLILSQIYKQDPRATAGILHLFNNTILAAADDDTELTKDIKKRVIPEYF